MKWFVELRFETIEKVLWAIGLLLAAAFLFWLPWDYAKFIVWPLVALFPALWVMMIIDEYNILPRTNDPMVWEFTYWGFGALIWVGVASLLVVFT